MLSRVWTWVRRDTTSTDWLIVLLTAVIAGTSYLQWHEIRSGGQDTHDLAIAAKTQAEKMKSMSDAADKIRQAAENMVTEDRRIADNAKNALAASNKQSEAVLDANMAASRLDQRAWMGLESVTGKPEIDKPFDISLALKNTGRTPADKVLIYSVYDPVPIGQAPDFKKFGKPISFGVASPNAVRFFIIHPSLGQAVPKEQLAVLLQIGRLDPPCLARDTGA